MNQDLLIIRTETNKDIDAIYHVHAQAFETPAEAELVNRLRQKSILFISLVAESMGEIVGHILFTPVSVEVNPERLHTIGLAPMAVLPRFQRKGVGARLIKEGLDVCKKENQDIVFVLGHTEYYPRFGFLPAQCAGLYYRDQTFAPYFFARELNKNVLPNIRGEVVFDEEFDKM